MKRNKLKILADENMPHVEHLFADFADIIKKPGREIEHKDLIDCDALLCRSVTQVDKQLLESTAVRFVGTATIGTDHLAVDWLNENDVYWTNAAGCNAHAVVQYVISAIAYWIRQNDKQLSEISLGIIGAGNVGTALASVCEALGIEYLLCDPPLKREGDSRKFIDLDSALSADVVSLHVPLVKTGIDKTFHLINQSNLGNLSVNQLLINASRGAVIDNVALKQYLQLKKSASVVLDVYENEPNIDSELALKCLLATPHIAGHTLEGKLRGSYMVYRAFCEHFKLPLKFDEKELYPAKNRLTNDGSHSLVDIILSIYNIKSDSDLLKNNLKKSNPEEFEYLRKNYFNSFDAQPRRDYSGWVCGENTPPELTKILI